MARGRQQHIRKALLVGQGQANDFRLLDSALGHLLNGGDHEVGERAAWYFGGTLGHLLQVRTDPGFQSGGGVVAGLPGTGAPAFGVQGGIGYRADGGVGAIKAGSRAVLRALGHPQVGVWNINGVRFPFKLGSLQAATLPQVATAQPAACLRWVTNRQTLLPGGGHRVRAGSTAPAARQRLGPPAPATGWKGGQSGESAGGAAARLCLFAGLLQAFLQAILSPAFFIGLLPLVKTACECHL